MNQRYKKNEQNKLLGSDGITAAIKSDSLKIILFTLHVCCGGFIYYFCCCCCFAMQFFIVPAVFFCYLD